MIIGLKNERCEFVIMFLYDKIINELLLAKSGLKSLSLSYQNRCIAGHVMAKSYFDDGHYKDL